MFLKQRRDHLALNIACSDISIQLLMGAGAGTVAGVGTDAGTGAVGAVVGTGVDADTG